jgi:hypothetical protein
MIDDTGRTTQAWGASRVAEYVHEALRSKMKIPNSREKCHCGRSGRVLEDREAQNTTFSGSTSMVMKTRQVEDSEEYNLELLQQQHSFCSGELVGRQPIQIHT